MAGELLSDRGELESLFDEMSDELTRLGTVADVVMVGMGAEAARTCERLAVPVPTGGPESVERRGNDGRNTA